MRTSLTLLLLASTSCYSTTYALGSEIKNLNGLNIARPNDRRGIYSEDGVINLRPDSTLSFHFSTGRATSVDVRDITVSGNIATVTPLVGAPLRFNVADLHVIGVQRFSMNRTFLLIALLASPVIGYAVICAEPGAC